MDLMLLVADLKLQVADLIHEVAGLRMEVPELRPGEIRLNLTTALLWCAVRARRCFICIR